MHVFQWRHPESNWKFGYVDSISQQNNMPSITLQTPQIKIWTSGGGGGEGGIENSSLLWKYRLGQNVF